MQLPNNSFLLVLLGGGLTSAAPIAEEYHSPHILCFDAVNPCGVIYSGCYDKRIPETRPQPPACPALPAPPKPPISISYSYSTSIKTITKTNIATITYTGTIPPPTTIVPPLPTSVSLITEIITITTDFGTTTSKDNCSTRTVCIDYIDKCGQTYGGCVPDCLPWPTFSAPPCPRPTTTTGVRAAQTVEAVEAAVTGL